MSPAQDDSGPVAGRVSDDRYLALLERTGYGAFLAAFDGRLVESNDGLATLLGHREPSELVGFSLAEDLFWDPADYRRLVAGSSAQQFSEWIVCRWKRRDGSSITVRVAGHTTRGSEGEPPALEGVVEDVTERQRRDEFVRRTERMATVGTTLAGVAHELNNPLAAIIGFAQLLLKRPLSAEDRSALEAINHEALRSATVVRNLLAMVRQRDGERRIATNVNDIVGYIVRTRRYALETAGIACRIELDPSLPMVEGDRAQLEQVVLNLLRNAEQALLPSLERRRPSPAWIQVTTRHDEQSVIIEVEDNGPGVPEGEASKIWDAFWTTKDEGEGTGLGLSVAHSIIVDHGGTISLEKTPSEGARFVIRIPIVPVAAQSIDRATTALDVLVVDSAESDVAFVERFLTSRGHAVINAGTPEAAVRLASHSAFDAILCDAGLTLRDGMPAASALRSTAGGSRARLFLSSASAADAGPLAASLDGATLVIRPYDIEELRRLIEGD